LIVLSEKKRRKRNDNDDDDEDDDDWGPRPPDTDNFFNRTRARPRSLIVLSEKKAETKR
jgi:hypothetical protein